MFRVFYLFFFGIIDSCFVRYEGSLAGLMEVQNILSDFSGITSKFRVSVQTRNPDHRSFFQASSHVASYVLQIFSALNEGQCNLSLLLVNVILLFITEGCVTTGKIEVGLKNILMQYYILK